MPRFSVSATIALLFLPILQGAPALALQGTGLDNSEWSAKVEKIFERLRDHKWKGARRDAKSLSKKVTTQSWHGPELDKVLAEIALARAIAEANLDDDRVALWYWHTASNLDFRLRRRDLSPYGRAAKLFKEFPLRSRGEVPPGFAVPEVTPLVQYRPPRQPEVETEMVLANSGAAQERVGDVLIEVVVDEFGRLHHPVVVSDYVHPIPIFAVLEWLLDLPPCTPAAVEGKRVDALYEVTVTFRFRRW